jgi:hypothetical protein
LRCLVDVTIAINHRDVVQATPFHLLASVGKEGEVPVGYEGGVAALRDDALTVSQNRAPSGSPARH